MSWSSASTSEDAEDVGQRPGTRTSVFLKTHTCVWSAEWLIRLQYGDRYGVRYFAFTLVELLASGAATERYWDHRGPDWGQQEE